MALSQKHKEALARGRSESRAIKQYLEALGSRKPGRPVTAESLKERVAGIRRKIAAERDPLKRVDLVQQRMDAEDQMRALNESSDRSDLELDFLKYAAGYSARKGISYSAWREAGVSAAVLAKAGIKRTRRS